MTTKGFIQAHHITMTAEWADSNPHMPNNTKQDQEWGRAASHYKCTFRMGRKRLTTYFSMGPAHTREPQAAEVLDCLASDAASIENARDFEDFASELGYDPDSRTAERIYKACEQQSRKLERFLGGELYNALLWETERD